MIDQTLIDNAVFIIVVCGVAALGTVGGIFLFIWLTDRFMPRYKGKKS